MTRNHNPNNTSLTLTRVPFDGDELLATQDATGVWVSITSICDALGIDPSRQMRKLRDKAWATMDMKSMVGADGRTRDMSCIHIDSLPMWLATIEVSRVNGRRTSATDESEGLLHKLVQYQREAARVLAAYFLRRPGLVALPEGSTTTIVEALAEVRTSWENAEKKISEGYRDLDREIAYVRTMVEELREGSLP